ncbi:hypothetical protein TNIN_374681 [Trichonephila inaurata madagascariensis]|uniref:Acyltransferase 3 domain-containing protein n=1 Tax=Trichonephila inaurata madagascariensis TaxID=2747483 RepID=A0A8X7C663_9ARAC|nr:hypothetical protein TNIN_374681 [Trichonephila inaurata madagascariensis]
MFFFSGFLVAYLFFQQSAKNKGIPWLYFYIHRFIRLTPVYMIVLAFYTSLSGYLGSGPVWTVPNTDPNCHSNWWWNFLYINNLQPAADACAGWFWYLANDMQFYVISPLFLVTLWRWPKIGFILQCFKPYLLRLRISMGYLRVSDWTRRIREQHSVMEVFDSTESFDFLHLPYSSYNSKCIL